MNINGMSELNPMNKLDVNKRLNLKMKTDEHLIGIYMVVAQNQ